MVLRTMFEDLVGMAGTEGDIVEYYTITEGWVYDTFDRVRNVIASFTYKQGYTFTSEPWFCKTDQQIHIRLSLHTPTFPDAAGGAPHRLTQHRDFPASLLTTETKIQRAIVQVVREWELHEMLEWLRFDERPLIGAEALHKGIALVYDLDSPVDIPLLQPPDALQMYGVWDLTDPQLTGILRS